MKHDREEQVRKLGKAAERFRMLAKFKMGRQLFADGIVVTAQPEANLFLVAEGIGEAGPDGLLLLEELDRTRKALADLVECHGHEPWRRVVMNAARLLEGVHEHTAISQTFGPN